MQTPGTYISAIGHVGLIGWLLLGWGLDADPLEFDAFTVTSVSSEEFEALTQAAQTPTPGEAEPDTPSPPQIDDTQPAAPTAEDTPEPAPPPEPVEEPIEENEPPAPPPVAPPTDVADAPPADPAPPEAPAPIPDLEVSDTPTPREAPVIAPIQTAPPEPDTPIVSDATETVEQTETTEPEPTPEPEPPQQPPDTTTETALENVAPTTSMRPQTRPSRPTPPAETQTAQDEPTETEPPDTSAAVDDLLADLALDNTGAATPTSDAPAVPVGPPLTGSEESAFRLAVSACWNVNTGSAAANVTVEVGFSLDRSRQVVGGEVRLISSSGGDDGAVRAAFDAARRAVLRCAVRNGGYNLPDEKYESWKDVVLTFDPSTMRLR